MRIVALCLVLVAAVAADGGSRYNPRPTYSSPPVQTYQPRARPVPQFAGRSSRPAQYGGSGRRTVITPGRLTYNRNGVPVSSGGGNRYGAPVRIQSSGGGNRYGAPRY